jgi:hypothetical protein
VSESERERERERYKKTQQFFSPSGGDAAKRQRGLLILQFANSPNFISI